LFGCEGTPDASVLEFRNHALGEFLCDAGANQVDAIATPAATTLGKSVKPT